MDVLLSVLPAVVRAQHKRNVFAHQSSLMPLRIEGKTFIEQWPQSLIDMSDNTGE